MGLLGRLRRPEGEGAESREGGREACAVEGRLQAHPQGQEGGEGHPEGSSGQGEPAPPRQDDGCDGPRAEGRVAMSFDVHVRFTVNAETEDGARRLLEDLLARFLDPTSTAFQDAPHSLLDSWSLRPEGE